MPELFCGFPRRPDAGPTLYPVACSPQAWASGAVLMLLRAVLGLDVDGVNGQVTFSNPMLPSFLDVLHIEGLRVGARGWTSGCTATPTAQRGSTSRNARDR